MTLPKGYGGQRHPSSGKDIHTLGRILCVIGFIMSAMALYDIFFLDGEFGSWWLPVTFGIIIIGWILIWYGGRRR